MKSKLKKLVIALVAMLTAFTAMHISTNIYAADQPATITLGAYTGYSSTSYNADGVHYIFNENMQQILIDGEIGFCVEPGILLQPGSGFVPTAYDRREIAIIAYEGWEKSAKTAADYVATQFMIWEAVGGRITRTNFSDYGAYKANIQNRIHHHFDKPSFDNQEVTLKVGESITLTDTKGIFKDFHLVDTGGLQVKKNGNHLTITATASAPEKTTVQYQKIPSKYVGTSIAYKKAGSQIPVKFKVKDPQNIKIRVNVQKYGSLKLAKQDDEGNFVPNTSFQLSYNADMSKPIGTYKTGADGTVTIHQLLPQTVYVQEVDVPDHLVLNSAVKSIKIEPNKVSAFTQINHWKKGKFQFVKKDADTGKVIQLANTILEVYDTSGNKIKTVKTDKTGSVTSEDLKYGDYVFKEVAAPHGYLLNGESFKGSIREDGVVVTVEIKDKRVKGKVKITKADSETGSIAQGDASLNGAIYGLYARENIVDPSNDGVVLHKKDTLVEQITLQGVDGSFSEQDLGKYYVKEIQAPQGYQLSKKEYDVALSYEGQNVPVVLREVAAKDKVITGNVEIHKYCADSDSAEVLKPEQGAEFTVILKSLVDKYKSFEEALKHTDELSKREYDVLVSDKNGYAKSKDLAYGEYVMKQTKTSDADILPLKEEITFTIHKQNEQFSYSIKNALTESYVKIVKYDKATQKEITLSNMSFKVWDVKHHKYVSQKVGNKRIDTFTTDEKGQSTLPLPLKSGAYELHEVKAPNGYLIHQAPIPFEVKKAVFEADEDGDPITVVKVYDDMPTGRIVLKKSFEATKDEVIKGAVFQLTANSEIINPRNGSVIYHKGDKVNVGQAENGRYELNEDGILDIAGLPLGIGKASYALQEIETADGYVLSDKKIVFDFEMKDDTTKEYVLKDSIENKQTIVEITKEDTKGKAIAGAEMQVFDEKDTLVSEWKTSQAPHTIKGLVVGKKYRLHEKEAPLGYAQAKDVYFTIENTEKVQSVVMRDIQVKVRKVDEAGKALANAKFIVTDTKTKQVVDCFTSDTKGNVVKHLIEGHSYILQEVEAPNGYVPADPVEFTLKDKDITITVENKPLKIELQLVKIDSDTKKPIVSKQFVFQAFADKECRHKLADAVIDTKKGTAAFTFRYGKYWIKEIQAPSGYQVRDDAIEVTVNEKGVFVNGEALRKTEQGYYFHFENTKLPATSDHTNLPLFFASLIISLFAFVLIIRVKR